MRRVSSVFLLLLILLASRSVAEAATLSEVSDLISTSAPGQRASHTIQFTVASAIPAGGSITITPESGAVSIPGSFDFSDAELAVATSSTYVDRSLAASPNAADDGMSAVSGSAGSVTFTLNSTQGIAEGDKIRITLASSSDPSVNLINSAQTRSYHIRIKTADSGGTLIDRGDAMIAIVAQVTVNAAVVQKAPILSDGLPTGTIAAGNTRIELSLDTDELATCRYATTTGVAYTDMTNQFLPTIAQSFYIDLSGFQNNTTYMYYVRCSSVQGMENSSDYVISFTLKPDPISNTSIASGGSSGKGGVGPFPNGSDVLYLGSVSFAGLSEPGNVTILQDGSAGTTATAGSNGSFASSIDGLERGVYSFELYVTDTHGLKSAPYTATLSIGQGSSNAISGITLPPTLLMATTTVAVGADATVSGSAIPGSTLELSVATYGSDGSIGVPHTYTASSSAQGGAWQVVIPGKDLSKGTYALKARSVVSTSTVSDYSETLLMGVGQAPVLGGACSAGKGDLNGDSKINLTDFSIMLTQWGQSGSADLNCDKTVGLADFSIMLYNWTG